MAMLDYGAILKIDGELKNINQGLFMEMKDAVGFTIDPIPYQYEWDGKTYDAEHVIEGNFFVYFGDEEIVFCVYKNMLRAVVDKNTVYDLNFNYEDKNIVKYFNVNNADIKIKKIHGSEKIHAKIQYKGHLYEVVYGYGIDNSIRVFQTISRKKRYGYNRKITRYIQQFLNLN